MHASTAVSDTSLGTSQFMCDNVHVSFSSPYFSPSCHTITSFCVKCFHVNNNFEKFSIQYSNILLLSQIFRQVYWLFGISCPKDLFLKLPHWLMKPIGKQFSIRTEPSSGYKREIDSTIYWTPRIQLCHDTTPIVP